MKKAKFVTSLILAGTMAVLLAAAPVLAQSATSSSPLFDRDIRAISRTVLWLRDLQDGDVMQTYCHYGDGGSVDGIIVLYRDLSEAPATYSLKQADGSGGSAEIAFSIAGQCRVRLIEGQTAEESPAKSGKVDSLTTALFARYELVQSD
jgi:hypothetical protein